MNMLRAIQRGAAETLAAQKKQRLDRLMADAVASMGAFPNPKPLPDFDSHQFNAEPCSNPRLVNSMGYTRNCRCGWSMVAHNTKGGAK
ncbi:MAG TPA: hypothetical protein DEQ40_09050 [Oxalobacteraceae bacterium]|jgi:hypothetical protein|nr:hypothetical protein [Oxalobacteraceae bacterium]